MQGIASLTGALPALAVVPLSIRELANEVLLQPVDLQAGVDPQTGQQHEEHDRCRYAGVDSIGTPTRPYPAAARALGSRVLRLGDRARRRRIGVVLRFHGI